MGAGFWPLKLNDISDNVVSLGGGLGLKEQYGDATACVDQSGSKEINQDFDVGS